MDQMINLVIYRRPSLCNAIIDTPGQILIFLIHKLRRSLPVSLAWRRRFISPHGGAARTNEGKLGWKLPGPKKREFTAG